MPINVFRSLLIAVALPAAVLSADMAPFSPGEVKVGGEIGRRMDVTLEKMLHHTDIDGVFARHFRNRKEKPDEPGGFAGYGMFLDALVKAAAHGIGGAETDRAKTRLLKELGEMQTLDGRISMFSGDPGFWDNHEAAYMIQALCLDHRWFGTADSLSTARKLADSLIAHNAFPTLGSETAYLLLYEETGERKYLDWVEKDASIAVDIDAYDRQVRVNGVQHVYTWLARALAQLQYADVAKVSADARAALSAAADEAIRRTRGDCMSVTGSITGTPVWGELWDATQVGLGQWGETCASAYLMRLSAKRIEACGDAALGDLFERVMYNAFFSAQSADGLKYRYWTPFNERAPWYDRDTYCCPNNYKREVFEIPDAVFFRRPDGLAVNLYADAELKADGAAATMRTSYPEDDRVTLDVCMKGRVLELRIPGWCEGATVSVAGGAVQKAAAGWFRVDRDFETPVRIELDLPMPARLVQGTKAQQGRVAVMRGPCVYALALGEDKPDHSVDCWDLDTTKPLVWNAEKKTVDATFRSRNRTREVRTMSLTRYSADIHDRTYFDVAAPVVKKGGGGFRCGMGLGGWLTNYKRFNVLPDMWRQPITIGDLEHFDSYITEADVARIAGWGFDHIRLGFDQIVLEEAPYTYRERTFRKIDEFVGWCRAHGLNVVLNLHKAVGNYCDIQEKVGLLDDAGLQDRFIALWLECERRYHDVPGVAFELLNEVRDVEPQKWNALADRTLKAIRAKNADRWVVVGSTHWGSPDKLKDLKVWDDPHVVYSFHMYEPHDFTHQRGVLMAKQLYYNRVMPYPTDDVERYREANRLRDPAGDGGYAGVNAIDREYLRAKMKGALDFVTAHPGKTLWNGEFGTIRHAPKEDRAAYMRDVVAICREWGIPYCVWNYLSTPNDGNRFSLVDDDTRAFLSQDLLDACLGTKNEGSR